MDGVLIINKPKTWTSHDVVAKMRRILQERRIGHAGTLDPFATGVLVLCIGQATRLSSYLTAADKTYVGRMRLGVATDTFDIEGQPVGAPRPVRITEAQLKKVFQQFTGAIMQRPPLYSAKKVNGQPLYKYARQGLDVPRPLKPVVIHSLDLHGIDGEVVSFTAHCSRGTFVRALAQDIGETLGCGAHLIDLARTRSGSFTLEQSLDLVINEEVDSNADRYVKHIVSMGKVLTELPAVIASDSTVAQVLHGQNFTSGQVSGLMAETPGAVALLSGDYRVLDQRGHLIAMAHRTGPVFHPTLVFNRSDVPPPLKDV
ncbi:MAG: tRNA pseudouridine(55) synthase TruB [Acidobacteria bacterium]|nr:tRNA pseudouridine(55) synthase TruB [Acidobacteriota bacterium]MBI3654861.1 tRNA pseudouridine(55) synthase TruB [Acidobacteriota bacterium]